MRDLNELRRLAEAATPGPWSVDGPRWNQIVWSSADNRVCFLAHSNGLDDARDIATGSFIAAANPATVLALLDRLERAEADSRGWAKLVGEMLAAVPLGHVLKAGATGADFVSYVKGCAAENDRLRDILAEAGKALEPFAEDELHEGLSDGPDDQRTRWPSMRLGDYRTARTVADKIEEALK